MQAIETINTLKKEREGMDAFLKAALRDKRCRRLDLSSFLVLPLQRVCKYPLLLRVSSIFFILLELFFY